MIAYKCAFDVQIEGEMYIKQPYSVASCQTVFFYIFFFCSIGNLDNYNCRLFGISIGTWYSIPGPNQVSICNLFERLATDKKDKCTLFRSEQEWKLYV